MADKEKDIKNPLVEIRADGTILVPHSFTGTRDNTLWLGVIWLYDVVLLGSQYWAVSSALIPR